MSGLRVIRAAQQLFDNRQGGGEHAPYALPHLWAELGAALYGEDDPRVRELRGAFDRAEERGP